MTLSEFERRAPPQPWSRHTEVVGEARPRQRDLPLAPAPGNAFVRLVTAKALAHLRRTSAIDVVDRLWPTDTITRAASAPAMTTTVGWAAELVRRVIPGVALQMQKHDLTIHIGALARPIGETKATIVVALHARRP